MAKTFSTMKKQKDQKHLEKNVVIIFSTFLLFFYWVKMSVPEGEIRLDSSIQDDDYKVVSPSSKIVSRRRIHRHIMFHRI